jgi:hypothetical protein
MKRDEHYEALIERLDPEHVVLHEVGVNDLREALRELLADRERLVGALRQAHGALLLGDAAGALAVIREADPLAGEAPDV